MCGTLDAVSSALGTDGGGGGVLGAVSDVAKGVGNAASDVLSNPLVQTAIAAGLIYETGGLLMSTEAGVAAGVAPSVGATVTADALATGGAGDYLAAEVGTSAYTGAGLTAGSGTVGLTSGGGVGLTAGSTLGAGAGASMSSLAGGAGAAAGAGWTANQILGAGSLASGVLGMAGAGAGAKAGANAADPFASQRPQYQAQLSALMANPNKVMPTMPGYQAGLQATERADAAQGFAGGGRAATDIAAYSGNFYNQQVQTLSGLAGANSGSPGAAGSIVQQGATNQQSALNTLMTGASLLWGK